MYTPQSLCVLSSHNHIGSTTSSTHSFDFEKPTHRSRPAVVTRTVGQQGYCATKAKPEITRHVVEWVGQSCSQGSPRGCACRSWRMVSPTFVLFLFFCLSACFPVAKHRTSFICQDHFVHLPSLVKLIVCRFVFFLCAAY